MARYTRSAVFTNVDAARDEQDNRAGQLVNEATVFVGSLDFRATELTLYQLFSSVGSVTNCYLAFNKEKDDPNFGRPKGWAFVTLSSAAEAERAIASLNGRTVGARQIVVKRANERAPSVPGMIPSAPRTAPPVAPLTGDQRRDAMAKIRQKLAQLRPADAAKRKAVADDVVTDQDEKRPRTATSGGDGGGGGGGGGGADAAAESVPLPPPSTPPSQPSPQPPKTNASAV
jgi:cold-inducible RNA-binding protein